LEVVTDLDDFTAAEVDADLWVIVREDLGVHMTYHQITGTVFDENTGISTATETDSILCVVMQPLSAREIAESKGLYQVGDEKFYVRIADFAIIPKRTDGFTYLGVRYNVIDTTRGSHNRIWKIVGRVANG